MIRELDDLEEIYQGRLANLKILTIRGEGFLDTVWFKRIGHSRSRDHVQEAIETRVTETMRVAAEIFVTYYLCSLLRTSRRQRY